VADRIDDFQSDHFVGEQLQGPVAVAGRGLTKPHGDQLRFGLAIELAGRGRFLAFLALQSQFKAFGNQALTQIFDRLHAAVERIGNSDIGPSWAISIRLEQNLSATKLLRRPFEILDNLLAKYVSIVAATLLRR
jgi:hypothetical protein